MADINGYVIKHDMKYLIFILLTLFLVNSQAETKSSKLTDAGLFFITYESQAKPIIINQMHAWVINIQDEDRQEVTDATIEIVGGMPEHDHGLPTQPRMTKNLGDGNYLLEGLKFHMHGSWVVTLSIEAAGKTDQVTFSLNL